MKTANRQAEVQVTQLQQLFEKYRYRINHLIDLRQTGRVLEGTGSLIFHHPESTIYAAISERCNKHELEQYASKFQYEALSFSSQSQAGSPIYHTNVLMSCGEQFAVICDSVLQSNEDSRAVMERLYDKMKDVIIITEQQMTDNFCGNILQLSDNNNQPVIIMSESAFNGFTPQQIKIIEKHGSIIACPIPTIEYIGGGSARCMIAENFLVK